jgi:hypothetical protein
MAVWRQMLVADLASVEAIAERVHVDYPEAPEIFANRLALFPAGCFMAVEGGQPMGYCISHPGTLGDPPPLDTLTRALLIRVDCRYLYQGSAAVFGRCRSAPSVAWLAGGRSHADRTF